MIFLRVLQLFVHPLIKEQRMLFFHKYIFDWILHNRLVECMSINGNNGRMIFCLAERMRSECGASPAPPSQQKQPITIQLKALFINFLQIYEKNNTKDKMVENFPIS